MFDDPKRGLPRRLAVVVIAALAAVGCAQDPAVEDSPTPSETAPASPTAQAPPTQAAPTTSPAPQPDNLTTPEDAAGHLLDAWKTGDRTLALKFAGEAAVDDVFSRPYTGPDPEFMGCDHEVDHYLCRFRYEGGSTTYRVDGGVSAGYEVTEVTQTAD